MRRCFLFYGYNPAYLLTYLSMVPYLTKSILSTVMDGVAASSPESLTPLVGWSYVPVGQKSPNG